MQKYLILVKHSLPEIVEGLPACEWKLSDEGKARARQLADQLRQFQSEVIASSMEPKAMQTAEIIADSLGLPFQAIAGLHEHDRSKASYLSRDEFRSAVQEFFEDPDRLVFGSETADTAHTRFYQAVHSIMDDHENQTIVIVSHGTVISLFISRLTGISDFLLWNELVLPSFVVIDMQSNTLVAKVNIS